MMPLPTILYPPYEERSRIPAETRRALRWEGIVGPLPVAPRISPLARLRIGLRAARAGIPEAPRAPPGMGPAPPLPPLPPRLAAAPAIAPAWLLQTPPRHQVWLEGDDEAIASLQHADDALLHVPHP